MKRILFIATIVFAVMSCEPDKRIIYPDGLSGTWTLVKVMAVTSSEITEIPEEQILWEFDVENNQLVVENHSEFVNLPLASGTYGFHLYNNPVETAAWKHKLEIDGVNSWFYDQTGLHLQLSDGQENGFHYDLIRLIDNN